jgi:hypothetical protein
MTTRIFYPPVELPTQVQAYAQGLVDHKTDYGTVPQNSPAELKSIVSQAKELEPMAQEIHDLELTIASKMEDYHKAAAPLWKEFSEKLGYAKVYAEKNDKSALMNFLRNYQHHVVRRTAAKSGSTSTK